MTCGEDKRTGRSRPETPTNKISSIRHPVRIIFNYRLSCVWNVRDRFLTPPFICPASEPSLELSRLKAWFPFVAFSGGITIGSVGRQLAAPPSGPKLHCD